MTDWEKELARIDKQLASLSDDKLIAAADAQAQAQGPPPATVPKGAAPGRAPSAPARAPAAVPERRSRWGLLGRVALAMGLGVAILFWPYGTTCGTPLFGYLASVVVLGATGVLAAVASWRQRAAVAHVLSLGAVLWAVVLGAAQVLPRTAYIAQDPAARATWLCP